MNHIYKVIFNKATGTFMAVAEYAKSHSGGGSSSTTGQVGSSPVIRLTRVATLAILAITAMFNSTIPAVAAGGVAVSQSSGTNNGNSSGSSEEINAHAEGNFSVAAGKSSHAKGHQSIAIGGGDGSQGKRPQAGAKAEGQESIAIGGDVTAKGDSSIAIGSDDLYLNNPNGSHKHTNGMLNTLIKNHRVLSQIRNDSRIRYRRTTAEGHASTAVGTMAYAEGHFSNAFGTRSTAKGNYSLAVGLTANAERGYTIAIGSNAQAINYGALAIGTDAQVNLDRGVALGYGSQILNNNNNNNAYAPDNTQPINSRYTATKNSDHTDILSIGNQSLRRKIINVGAGYQDTDAVNVAQLKAVAQWAERPITFKGDNSTNNDDSTVVKKRLSETLTIQGGKTANLTENNIGVVADNANGLLKVKLAKELTKLTKVEVINNGNGDNTAELLNGSLTFTQVPTNGTNSSKTVYGVNGLKFNDNSGAAIQDTTRITKNEIGFADAASGAVDINSPYLDKKRLKVGKVEITKDDGINAGEQKISNLAVGTEGTDATIKHN